MWKCAWDMENVWWNKTRALLNLETMAFWHWTVSWNLAISSSDCVAKATLFPSKPTNSRCCCCFSICSSRILHNIHSTCFRPSRKIIPCLTGSAISVNAVAVVIPDFAFNSLTNGQHFQNPWPRFACILCHLLGDTTKIKPRYRRKIQSSLRMHIITWPMYRGSPKPHITIFWPGIVYSLFYFYGATTMIKGSL